MVGKSLGHYEIIEPLGAGGMGEVYRARDSSLKRDVAIKVLPEDLSDDPDRLARLKREAHLLAALNHPNIATIHALEEADTTRFLVMELVKGESLEQRLAGGRLPVDEALDICRQIAEALEAAHAEGIIHRDLKPANVLITPEGRAKVLDFGLAKTAEADPSDVDISHSPTLTVAGTQTGVIIGTAPYMSPEQVRGQPLDKRADIWAFGCVLYETLAGTRAFNRETVADTLAAILEVDPPWDALPRDTPPIMRALLLRCLRKDPRRRLRDIGDARIELEEALSGEEGLPAVAPGLAVQAPLWRRALPWTVAGIAVVALAAVVVVSNLMRSTAPVEYLTVNLQPGMHLWGGHRGETTGGGNRPSTTAFVLTPDGRDIVYAATDGDTSQLYLHRRTAPEANPIRGTEGGSSPFLSPDGQTVGFVVGNDILTVPIAGGEPDTALSDAPFRRGRSFGVSWTDETIVFSGEGGIFRVPASGGAPEQISFVRPDRGEAYHLHPQLLPGGTTLLYTVQKADWVWETTEIVALPIGGEPILLVSGGADARYSPTGLLVFASQGRLMAAGFDPNELELSDPVSVLDADLMQAVDATSSVWLDTGAAQFSLSDSGSLAYATGGVHPQPERPPFWIDQDGKEDPFPAPPGNNTFYYARISPDGNRVAYRKILGNSDADLAVFDLDPETRRVWDLPLPGRQADPAWSPDGERLAFLSNHDTVNGDLYWIAADLSGELHRITENDGGDLDLSGWIDDDTVGFWQDRDIWVVDVTAGTDPEKFVDGPGNDSWAAFSPDGRWLAYSATTSRDDPSFQIYVRPYPAGDPAYAVTTDGGISPAWSHDTDELFYRNGQKMMAHSFTVDGGVPRLGPARELFERRVSDSNVVRSYDVAPDGRFLMMEYWEHPDQAVTQINIVQNWIQELKQRVAPGR